MYDILTVSIEVFTVTFSGDKRQNNGHGGRAVVLKRCQKLNHESQKDNDYVHKTKDRPNFL
jgi:hypothetical protein